MTIIVTDEGFFEDTWSEGFAKLSVANDAEALGCAIRHQPGRHPAVRLP